jgi:hypothetical protein
MPFLLLSLLLQGAAVSRLQLSVFTPWDEGRVLPAAADFHAYFAYYDARQQHEHEHHRGAYPPGKESPVKRIAGQGGPPMPAQMHTMLIKNHRIIISLLDQSDTHPGSRIACQDARFGPCS